jgi:hypothetical protein
MDTATRRTIQSNLFKTCLNDDINKRGLITLLKANAEIARANAMYRTDAERVAAMVMVRPGDSKTVFALFGLIFGSLPLLATAMKIAIRTTDSGPGLLLWAGLFTVAAVVTGITGFALGRLVPQVVSSVAHFRLPNRVAAIILIGLCWGGVAGAAGGFFLFVIGALFGAVFGGILGAVTLPLLVGFHSALRAGDYIERRHFLPFVFGITLTLCAFIVGV